VRGWAAHRQVFAPVCIIQALVLKRAPLAICLSALLLATSSAGATGWRATADGGATAQAYAIRVLVPGQAGGATPTLSAPPDAVQFSGGFTYGTGIVSTGSANASVSAVSGTDATASASAEVSSVSIFGGEITASDITAQARAEAKPGNPTGDNSGSNVTNLVALGQAVANGANVSLADWGTLRTIEASSSSSAATGYHGFVTAVDIHLTADHGGLPAGSSILIGYASVAAQSAPEPPPTTAPGPTPQKGSGQKPGKQPPAPNPIGGLPPLNGPLSATPPLHTPGGNVFPVYGPSSYTDSYGATRGDVSGGWHHGDDIFAPLGAPVLAIASGTVFSVGWNQVGGNRLWLRDGAGNEYYYAHLSAYTPLARNGAVVNAGDVLGFVGNTGDAQGTPYHLHFEIHPVGLLGLGYDGAVDPTTYLNRWRHVQDVSFAGGTAWVPAAATERAPKPGAILISSTDISSANGLEPGSLQRVLAPQRAEGVAFPAAAPVQKTQSHRSAAASH
jgi:murein DD-endopeptidase MepM/ murein hydrolase activator NlpD